MLDTRINTRIHRREAPGLCLPGTTPIKACFGKSPHSPHSPHYTVDPYIQILERGYRPPLLPLAVHLYGPERQVPVLCRCLRFYAKGGVHPRPMLDDHFDCLTRHELVPELVKALEADFQEVE